ncbi:Lcl C-terminal domain-containing protein [Desulfogranum japonicum]|uniref:Lcl C-terminal domain-containing protein n=1 Tax=Desulfogranum japonicum TaxID=231447 RepID=UPI0004236927|nr:DUF1566 domain-containing protein [Desulfogranum japonicum]
MTRSMFFFLSISLSLFPFAASLLSAHDNVVVIPLLTKRSIEPFGPVPIDTNIPDSVYSNNLVTVSDIVTRLEWQRVDDNIPRNYNDAYSYCIQLGSENFAGHRDWRLPSIWELQSIVDYREAYPAIKTNAFLNTNQSEYWSSTIDERSAEYAYALDFQDGAIHDSVIKNTLYLTRCVRSGVEYDSNGPYVVDGTGTATDLTTGLVWQRIVEDQTRTYSQAMSYCDQLSLAGGGWRLPNAKELASLFDYRLDEPMFNPSVFPLSGSLASGFKTFWSRTSYYIDGSQAWYVSFSSGSVRPNDRTEEYYTRCVR